MRKFVLLIMIVLSAGALALAQNKRISGTVKGVDGKPIAGATVLVEGTSIGTTTNAEGRFSVQAPADGTLVVSFIGYASKSVNIAGKTRLDIALKEDTHAIDDVIVVAYGTAKKESFTGSVAVVKGEEALDGLAPGVQVTSGSGQPGSGTTVAIRGFGSINASSTPLYVVDGIPYDGAISAINPDDIASISILKDASASVLYGARGANGVVLINTKKGNRNETNVELKINVGVSSRAIPRYETVGARDFMEIMYSAFYNDYGSNAVAQMASGSKRIFGSNEMYNPYDVPLAQLFTADGKVRDDTAPAFRAATRRPSICSRWVT